MYLRKDLHESIASRMEGVSTRPATEPTQNQVVINQISNKLLEKLFILLDALYSWIHRFHKPCKFTYVVNISVLFD